MTSEGTGGDPLTDAVLQSEIELVGDLVAAASESEGPLGEQELDRVLGVAQDDVDHAAGPVDPAAEQEDAVPEDTASEIDVEGEPGHGQPAEDAT